MKIVNILGGLGNQMFQYAFALSLQSKYPHEKILLDIHGFKGYGLHNGFELSRIFNLALDFARERDIIRSNLPTLCYKFWQIRRSILPKMPLTYLEDLPLVFKAEVFESKNKYIYYDGYWQSEKYFSDIRPIILKAFKFKPLNQDNIDLYKRIEGQNSVSLHVRRGDYIKDPYLGGITNFEYYKRAIEYMESHAKVDYYLVFSDDIKWCRDNLKKIINPNKLIFIDWNKGEESFRDMQLMSLCKHNIIANSSFSWWGAWLNNNENKIVVSPKIWCKLEYDLDIIPASWVGL